MLAFPGCSEFFNTDRITLFNPHINPAELEILIPCYRLGN